MLNKSITMMAALLLGTAIGPAGAQQRNMPAEQNARVMEIFQEQARVMEARLDGQMQIFVLPTDDPLVRGFIASGLTKTTPEDFEQKENGLASVISDGGMINGVKSRACYVVYNKERAGHIWSNFLVPMGRDEDLSIGAAFLIGHEVAHCLDGFEQRTMLAQQPSWATEKAATFGILPDAWRLAGGGDTISLNSFNERASQVRSQRAQMQYIERLADIFAVLWTFSQGAEPEMAEVVRKSRNALDWSTHATIPALVGIEKHAADVKNMPISEIWALSRGLQVQAGVHESVALNGEKAGPVIIKAKADSKVQQDDGTDVAAAPITTPAPQKNSTVNFNALPKFGQRGFSGN